MQRWIHNAAVIGVIINRNSRLHRERPALAGAMADVLGSAGSLAITGDLTELRGALERFRRQGATILALSGGDGTNSFCLGAIQALYGPDLPDLALLGGGTNNTIMRSLGMPRRSPVAALRALVEARASGGSLRRTTYSTVTVAGSGLEAGAAQGQTGFLFGVGAGRQFLEEYYARGVPHPTPTVAAKTLLATVGSAVIGGQLSKRVAASSRLSLTIDGSALPPRDYVGVFAGTVGQVGLGFRPLYRAGPGIDGFHVLALHGGRRKVVVRLPQALVGRPMGDDCATDVLARTLAVDSSVGSVGYFLDGDLHSTPSPLCLGLGPRAPLVWAAPPP